MIKIVLVAAIAVVLGVVITRLIDFKEIDNLSIMLVESENENEKLAKENSRLRRELSSQPASDSKVTPLKSESDTPDFGIW